MNFFFGLALAFIAPLFFLGLIRQFDLYRIGQSQTILACAGWGAVAFAPAALTHSSLARFQLIDQHIIGQFVAPVLEEALKALILIYLIRRPQFTYFLDGALYGFATGIGFAIAENIEYITHDQTFALTVAFQRTFSTTLIHASSSAVIGAALGVFRLETSRARWLVLALGLFLAIGQHISFNIMIMIVRERELVLSIISGFLGVFFIALIMQHGQKQARKWITQKLGMGDRVTRNEVNAVDRLGGAGEPLRPVFERFGAETAGRVEKLLYLQARLGIKRKTLDSFRDNAVMRNAVEAEIRAMRTEMEEVRRAIGTYAMLFVRGLFTDEMASVWDRMQVKIQERSAVSGGQKGCGLWSSLEQRVKSSREDERLE
jgi:RsiW-degrading membrane proteinase PrsW (M82 family)